MRIFAGVPGAGPSNDT